MAHSSGAAAPTTPAFTLVDVQDMLHQHAYGGDRRTPAVATREQYSAFCEQLQTVENTAIDLANLGAGLYLLIGLLEDGPRFNVDPLVGKALRGLLQPMSAELERHADALHAASTRAPTTN